MSKTTRFLARQAERVKQNQRRRQESVAAITPETIETAMAALLKATEAVVIQTMADLVCAVKALQSSPLHQGGIIPAGDPVVPALLPSGEAIAPKAASPDPEEGGPCPTGCGANWRAQND